MSPLPTVAAASSALIDGSLTSAALVQACLDRIAARDSAVRAWTFLDPDAALKQARLCDRQPRRSLIHGIPIGIKDVFDTADMPTAYGAAPFQGHQPALDSAAVAMLRRAGAVILGKTKTTEFATFHPSDAANPANPAHTPGGSSSGSAAAVADAMVPAAAGTQTMGSVIRPAAYCGAVGYKPSFGSIARAGLALLSESNDTIGLFSRAAADLPLLMGALTGVETTCFQGNEDDAPRIGVLRGPDADLARPEALDALAETARAFAGAGGTIRDIDSPAILIRAMAAHMTITLFEMARNLAAARDRYGDGLSSTLTDMMKDGAAIPLHAYHEAQHVAEEARAAIADLFTDFDMLLTFSAPGEAPKGLSKTGDPVFNRLWSLVGGPCVALPVGVGPNGLPVGVQIVGPRRADAQLLGHAVWAERALAARR